MATRIEFELGGRQYEAVSFLKSGEPSVNGDTMIARTDGENGGGVGEEEGMFLWEHRGEWPAELKGHPLVCTKWRFPNHPRGVQCFDWDSRGGYRDWLNLDDQWDDRGLVIRRRV